MISALCKPPDHAILMLTYLGVVLDENLSYNNIADILCNSATRALVALNSKTRNCKDLGPLLQGQTRIAKLKSAYNSFIIGPRGLGW